MFFEDAMDINGIFPTVAAAMGCVVVASIGDARRLMKIEIGGAANAFAQRPVINRVHRFDRSTVFGKIDGYVIHFISPLILKIQQIPFLFKKGKRKFFENATVCLLFGDLDV